MPFPLAHPAAVLPLRSCSKSLSFAALVTASVVPDIAYFADDYSKFNHVLVGVFGSWADKIPFVDSKWEWSDFSHSIVGSLVFCLPIGLLVQAAFYPLRTALVSTFPNPHRAVLLPLCNSARRSVWVIGRSLLIGTWIHLFWDLFTHDNARSTRTWELVRRVLGLSAPTQSVVQRVVWVVSSVGGAAALIIVYLGFLRRNKTPWLVFNSAEAPRLLLWLGMIVLPALITWPVINASTYGEPSTEFIYFFHAFAELYLMVFSGAVLLLSLIGRLRQSRITSPQRN